MKIHTEMLKQLRAYYMPGTEVELVHMNDPYRKMKPGLCGVVTCVDDTGTIFVNWSNGSTLGVVFGEDKCRKIENK